MDKTFLVSSSLVTVASGVAFWALLKLYEARGKLKTLSEKYNDPKSVHKSLMHQYGSLDFLPMLKDLIPKECENFHERLASVCKNNCVKYNVPLKRVLDVGCSTGSGSFYLSEFFDEVIGTDISYFMTITCQTLKDTSETTCIFPIEGGFQSTSFRARVPSKCHKNRVLFWDEDASNLDYTCGLFSCIVVANSLTELSNPKIFLKTISDYVINQGILIIVDTYNWINGPEFHLEVDSMRTFDFLKTFLEDQWEFKEEMNMPFYLATCERRAEVGNSHVTVWKKKIPSE